MTKKYYFINVNIYNKLTKFMLKIG